MIKIIENEDILPHVKEFDIVIIGTNTYCTLGNGVQRDISLNYPYADVDNKKTKYGDVSKLGTILTSEREGEPTISLFYIVKGYVKRKDPNEDWLDYDALEKCLKLANILYKGKNVACPMLGCSRWDGNGDKTKVMELITNNITSFDLTVFDYFQKSRDEKQLEMLKAETAIKESGDYKGYYAAVKKRKEEAEKRFKRNGHARY